MKQNLKRRGREYYVIYSIRIYGRECDVIYSIKNMKESMTEDY